MQQSKEELELRVQERTSELDQVARELVASNRELEQFAMIASHDSAAQAQWGFVAEGL